MAERMHKGVKYLVIGANGLIGRFVTRLLMGRGESWEGFYHRRFADGLTRLNITDKQSVHDIIAERRPKVVFHCANLAGGVDFCEAQPDLARDFHINGTRYLSEACARVGASLIFISSDYVFSDLDYAATEEDTPEPLNIYGRLKLEAEQLITSINPGSTIIRTTNVYGWDPFTVTPNYMMNLYRTLNEGKRFGAPSFLWGNPTYAGDLAEVLLKLADLEAYGVFHVVGADYVNRYEWVMKACEVLDLDASLVDEVKEPPANMVKRPMILSLNTDKVTNTVRKKIPGLEEGLVRMRKEMHG